MKKPILTGLASLILFGATSYVPLEIKAGESQNNYKQQLAREDPATLLARALWGEARSCTREEKIAIGYTALNRQRKTQKPLVEILLSGYTCFKGASQQQILSPHIYDDPKIFDQCIKLANGILRGAYRDPTNGATHYYNPRRVNPYWASALKAKKHIQTSKGPSKHIFGKMK